MHVIIGGFGRVGQHLARVLEDHDHTVTIVDRNASAFAEHGDGIKGRKLTGEVFDREVLIKAGIERADAYAAVTSGDNSNIVSARLARERFGVPNVVARIYDPRRAVLYERFGIPTVSSVQWAATQLVATILEPELRLEVGYGGGEVLTVRADAPLSLTGKRIGEIEYKGKFEITAVVRNGVAQIPSSRFELLRGDHLFVTVTRDALEELKQLLGIH